MTIRKMKLIAVLGPLVSLAAAIGAVSYQYGQLAAANEQVARNERTIVDLRDRVSALRREQGLPPGHYADDGHDHDHDHAHED